MKRAMRRKKTWQRQAAAITAAMMAMSVGGIAYAMPQGEVIRSGKGEITRQDKDMTVNQDSKRLAIDWSGFDIANDERVTFRQPDKDSVALNRVVGDAASVIDGTLSGNGHVYVINPNGVLFGKNASVDVGSLVASTARISDSDMTNFANADGITMAIPEDSSAKVINAGTIRAEGGLVVLHAAEVENSGTITNPEGTTALAAARNLSLSADTAGKINFTVDGALAKAKALNSGVLKADGGYLVMTARSAGDVMSTVVNNTGTMEAKTLRQNEKGEILLDGGDNGIVELNGTLDASGMEAGQSAGSIKAIGAETHVEDGATLHAIGAVDGGLIETSGDYLEIGDNVDIDAAGKTGKAGEWLLDPLEVVISDSNSRPTDSEAVESDKKDEGNYSSSNNASGTASRNKTTWVNSDTVNTLLNKGTAVSVQATDANKVASITLNSAINKTSGADTSLTLEAQRNVTVNAGIKSTSGALDANLHSDTDGDGLGAVLINADIATNGGTFTSVSGTTIESGSVGTYFGNKGEMGGRKVTTNGGAINLYGDVAIGLNGGTLTLDTKNKTTGASGAVKVTGTVDSGNSYKRVSSGLEGWTDFVKSYYDEVMRTVPTYTLKSGAKTSRASESSPRYILYSDGTVSRITSGRGYKESDLQATGKTITLSSYDELSASQKSNLSSYLAAQSITWAGAKAMAQGATEGTNHTGDTYLATITTALENSLASPPEEYQLIVGGRGSGSKDHPIDRQYPDGYYWVTGPEGMANGGKGTKFAENDGSAVNNYYVKWNYSYSQDTGQTEREPNNSGPIVSIGFGTASNWDDVKEGAGTIRGFVQEKNLEHSGLVINAGDSAVDIAGNIGNSVALKNVKIDAGDVTIGSGEHYTGIVHSDERVSITGKDVTVGDRITADTKGVDIQATGDINVDGITAHENINLTTTGESGAIVLNHTHNDGALITKSTDNDAVIIDARGTDGSFKNLTTAENAITTGKDGNWKVYSASPDRDTFGTNLKSETTARWHASSQGGNGLDTYAETEDTNKYIFQVQPTITVKADDQTKTYGDTADVRNYTTTATASFTGRNGEYSVSDKRFTPAFREGNLKDRYTGEIELSSDGVAAGKTRMDGDIDRTSSDNAHPYFVIKAEGKNLVGKEGYAVTTANGTLEILRRDANISGTGTQTYGTPDISWTTTASNLKNNDQVGTVTIKEGSAYTDNQKDRTTADAGTYENSAAFGSILNEKGEDASINYNLTGTGTIQVDKADLTVSRKGIETVYGTVKKDPGDMTTYTDLVNGDKNDIVIDNGNYGKAYSDDLKTTNNVGKYNYKATLNSDSDVLRNYNLIDEGTNYVNITPLNITEDNVNDFITNATYTTVYGSKADFGQAVFTGVNGDGTRDLSITGSSALTGNTEGVITKDAAENAYNTVVSLDGLSAQDKKNYGLEDTSSFTFDNSATVEKADLTVSRKGIDTVYGTVKLDPGDMTTYTDLVNGDTDDIVINNGNYGTAYNDELTKTNNVGKYDYKATLNSASDVLRNYNVHDDGMNYVNITPYTITDQEVVNLDGSPLYTTKYGQKDAFGTATFTGVNGDGTYELEITDSSALKVTGENKVTRDVGKNIYDTTVELSEAMNGNYQFADGATSKTFENTASVTPAELTIKTKDVETEYGTVKTTTSEVDGLVNGDLPTGFIYDYGNYGGAYLDGNTKTNNVNTYHFGTKLSGAEFLKNYTITGGEADVKIDPKDVTFFVTGTGNTLTDVTYTVDPDIDAQLAYGEHVDADYTPGNDLGSNQYGVVAHINGTPIVTGDVAGNYRYNYGGLITLSPTVPTKPDIDPHNPSNLDGSGSWTSNMGNHGVPGVERVAGLASAELPFFKVEAGQVSHYGTYDVAADPDKVRLEPTGKRLPEPNQPKTQYREYTKALTTTDGTGMFRMVYDGSTFNITPVDDGALALMRMGDVKNNVELSAEALHAGFSEMGILLEDLDGVYVHFNTMA